MGMDYTVYCDIRHSHKPHTHTVSLTQTRTHAHTHITLSHTHAHTILHHLSGLADIEKNKADRMAAQSRKLEEQAAGKS